MSESFSICESLITSGWKGCHQPEPHDWTEKMPPSPLSLKAEGTHPGNTRWHKSKWNVLLYICFYIFLCIHPLLRHPFTALPPSLIFKFNFKFSLWWQNLFVCFLFMLSWMWSQWAIVSVVEPHRTSPFQRSDTIPGFVHTDGLTAGKGWVPQIRWHITAVTPSESTGYCRLCLIVPHTTWMTV